MSISILILTLNEESNIEDCIASVAWSDDIVVLDSHSTDRTTEIAERKGARVFHRHFDDWASHQNWAVRSIPFRNHWVFYLDADERCDDTLKEELEHLPHGGKDFDAFQVRRKDFFMGRWLKRAQYYPTWLTRIFRPEKIVYERLVNPVANVKGKVGHLQGHLIHYPFSHGIAHWFERHNRYSDMEANLLIKEVKDPNDWRGLISTNTTRRRKALKRLAYGMPLRPCLTFLYFFFMRWAFLDGMPGFHYVIMRSIYEYMINLKVKERRYHEKECGQAFSRT